jgi:NAD(P)H dehydrogenase (quinone)
MILVTGATGRVGYHLMEALADARADATAMVRVEARGADLPGPGKHIVASFDDPPPPEVLQDFDRVFLLSPATEEQAELEIRFIDALVTAGHRPHVVKIAADGFADPDCDVRFMRSHRAVAVHLDATGLPVSYLAPVSYLENLLDAAETIRREATLYAPAGRGRVAFIAASDVADVAARVLASSGHEAATYVLTGPEALGYDELASRISAVFGRDVGYTDLPVDRAREQWLGSGMTPWQVEGMLEMFEWIRGGGTDSVTSDVAAVTGQAARPAEDWLSEFRAVFLSPPLDVPPPGI